MCGLGGLAVEEEVGGVAWDEEVDVSRCGR